MNRTAAAARLAAAACLASLLACSSSTDNHRQPLATVNGKLVSAQAASTGALRLAVAWYPSFASLSPTAPAGAIVTQPDVTYQGDFPIAFTFSLYDPPPAAAFSNLAVNGGSGRIAYGVLLAYEDTNGNGVFNPAPAGGALVDRVVGLSVHDPSLPPPARSHYLIYLDGTIGDEDYFSAFALPQGYSLLEVRNNYGVEPVSLAGEISIPITATPAARLYGCPDVFSATGYFETACGIDPFAGRTQTQGNVHFTGLSTLVFAMVYDGQGWRGDATVTFDGNAVSYDPVISGYDGRFPAAAGGAHEIGIAVPGQAAETVALTAPGPLTISAPADGATLLSGAPVTIAWTEAADVAYYDIYFYAIADDGTTHWLFHALTSATTITTPPLAYAGETWLTVKAVGAMGVGSSGSFFTPVSQRSHTLTIAR